MPKDLNEKKVNRAGRIVEAAQHLRAGFQGFQVIAADMADGLDFNAFDPSGSLGAKHVDKADVALAIEAAAVITAFIDGTKLSDGSTIRAAVTRMCPS